MNNGSEEVYNIYMYMPWPLTKQNNTQYTFGVEYTYPLKKAKHEGNSHASWSRLNGKQACVARSYINVRRINRTGYWPHAFKKKRVAEQVKAWISKLHSESESAAENPLHLGLHRVEKYIYNK